MRSRRRPARAGRAEGSMPRERPVIAPRRRLRHTRRPAHGARSALRVADVALVYGERSGGIRTYLDAKAAWAHGSELVDHHVVVPGPAERHEDGRHELPSLRLAATRGYRLPPRGG